MYEPSTRGRPVEVASRRRQRTGILVALAVILSFGFSGAGVLVSRAPTAAAATAQDAYVPLTQAELVDTRNGTGLAANPLQGGTTYNFAVGGRVGVPTSGVVAVSLDIWSVNATAASYLTVWPTGQARPPVTDLFSAPGQDRSNTVFPALGTNGDVSVLMGGGATDFVVYINGYFQSGTGDGYKPLDGTRVLDTRNGTGTAQQPLAAGATLTFSIIGAHVPGTADAAVLTFTMTSTASPKINGGLAAYPPGQTTQRTAFVYAPSTTTLSAFVQTSGDANQRVTVINNGPGPVDFAVDVTGYFAPDGGRGSFNPLSAVLYDTRTANDPIPANGEKVFSMLGQAGLPSGGVGAVAITLTVVHAGAGGTASVWGRGLVEPSISSIAFDAGATVSSTTIVDTETPATGQLQMHNISSQPLDVLISIQGWFSPFFTTPNTPTNTKAVAGNGNATVSWTAPADDGGTAISSYSVAAYKQADNTALTPQNTPNGTATSYVYTGLTNGTAYYFRVSATNSTGPSPLSANSNAVTPAISATVPTAPTNVSATGGDSQATISWGSPSSDGGSNVTHYTVTAKPSAKTQTTTLAQLSLTFTGLTNGTSYTFTVHATNAVGNGPESAPSNAVTPTQSGPGNENLWGVDTEGRVHSSDLSAITTDLGKPDFVARYMGNQTNPGDSPEGTSSTLQALDFDSSEVSDIHGDGVAIMPIERNYEQKDMVGSSMGQTIGQQTVQDATSWNIPKGTAIFIDVEPYVPSGDVYHGYSNVDPSFIKAWYSAVTGGGYVAGFYGSDLNPGSQGPSGYSFATAFCSAISDVPAILTNSVLWTFDPSVGGSSKAARPAFSGAKTNYGCSTGSTNAATQVWQYGGSSPSGSVAVDDNDLVGNVQLWQP